MTEAEWLSGDDLAEMVTFLVYRRGMERKYRLFALECVRVIRNHLRDSRSLAALEFVEANAEKLFRNRANEKLRRQRSRIEHAADAAFQAAEAARQVAQGDDHCHPDVWNQIKMNADAADAARCLLYDPPSTVAILCDLHSTQVVAGAATEPYRPGEECESSFKAYKRQRAVNLAWFRDIFANPFRPVAFESWRTSTVVTLAQQMYDSRDFALMPILGDALQDAGCESADILDHCRGDGPHVRGCWVVDLVLGKS
jgi:hypothetical protein